MLSPITYNLKLKPLLTYNFYVRQKSTFSSSSKNSVQLIGYLPQNASSDLASDRYTISFNKPEQPPIYLSRLTRICYAGLVCITALLCCWNRWVYHCGNVACSGIGTELQLSFLPKKNKITAPLTEPRSRTLKQHWKNSKLLLGSQSIRMLLIICSVLSRCSPAFRVFPRTTGWLPRVGVSKLCRKDYGR